jgi:hypothetical protein
MNWHLEILPLEQLRLWENRIIQGFNRFCLYGGTALALRMGHRISVDFDFFSNQPFVPLELKEDFGLTGEILQAEKNTLTLLVDGVKVSFFGGLPFGCINPPDSYEKCSIASLQDLAGCKLAALWQRVAPKDYQDIAALLRAGLSLSEMLGCGRALYGEQFPPMLVAKSVAYFDDPLLESLSEIDREILENAVSRVSSIPKIALSSSRILP